MTLPASRYYTTDDLTRFSLDKYTALAGFSFAQWRDLVQDRLHARYVVDTILKGAPDAVPSRLLEHWKLGEEQIACEDKATLQAIATRLRTAPLENLDATVSLIDASRTNPTATATVRPITGRYLHDLHARSEDAGILGSEWEIDGVLLDRLIRNKPDLERPLVSHLAVNMDATDKQLLEDFEKWLKSWRKATQRRFKNKAYETVRSEWCENMVVPYFDLHLIGRIENKLVREDDLKQLLFPDLNGMRWQNTRRALEERWTSGLFSITTLSMLAHLSHDGKAG